MGGYRDNAEGLEARGIAVAAASADSIDKAREVGEETGLPVGYGVTSEVAALLGAWWERARSFIQPAEFVLGSDESILYSSYSAGPLGRIEAADIIKLVDHLESQKK